MPRLHTSVPKKFKNYNNLTIDQSHLSHAK